MGKEVATGMADEQKQPITPFLPSSFSQLWCVLVYASSDIVTGTPHCRPSNAISPAPVCPHLVHTMPLCLHPRSHQPSSYNGSRWPSALSRPTRICSGLRRPRCRFVTYYRFFVRPGRPAFVNLFFHSPYLFEMAPVQIGFHLCGAIEMIPYLIALIGLPGTAPVRLGLCPQARAQLRGTTPADSP